MHVRSAFVARAFDAALRLVDEREQELCLIIESSESSPDEKYQALLDLAYMTGTMAREMTETSED
jgi:hypothetical protein